MKKRLGIIAGILGIVLAVIGIVLKQKENTAVSVIGGADGPTGNLDSQTELEVMSLLKSCVSDFGQTLIMITHDETIAQMADEMIIIEDGKAVRR